MFMYLCRDVMYFIGFGNSDKTWIFKNLLYMFLYLCRDADMQKVENLPPADFQVKISAKGQNQVPLLEHMNFRQFSEIFR